MLGAEYELLSLIGQGGFARVYKARDRRLDRIVAIKVIRPDLIGTELFMESFRNEGIALAKLRHPGIVPIYDIRERGGLIYYVMPFVQGTTLEERLDRGRLPPYESRRILSELTDALAAAHRVKMVHLDIKPANVFLEGDLQKVLLMDFGIAMAITEEVEESSGGPVAGTPAYMSPEQARGLPEIDHRSDIYSLGALGYRMLMGRPPFSGRDGTEVLTKHVKEAPVPIRDDQPHDSEGLRGRHHEMSGEGPVGPVPNGEGTGSRTPGGDVLHHAGEHQARRVLGGIRGRVRHHSSPSSSPSRSSSGC